MKPETTIFLKRIRRMIIAFMVFLILSGITAFPVQSELSFLIDHLNWFPEFTHEWLLKVADAINVTATNYPFLLYGYDWLAFSHIVIAIFFYGVYRDPIRNAWVLHVGMIACIGVFILAFASAGVRGIPIFWTLIDCSFGLFGIIPLIIVQRWINRLERIEQRKFTNSPHKI